jgi:hypothetical protein
MLASGLVRFRSGGVGGNVTIRESPQVALVSGRIASQAVQWASRAERTLLNIRRFCYGVGSLAIIRGSAMLAGYLHSTSARVDQ